MRWNLVGLQQRGRQHKRNQLPISQVNDRGLDRGDMILQIRLYPLRLHAMSSDFELRVNAPLQLDLPASRVDATVISCSIESTEVGVVEKCSLGLFWKIAIAQRYLYSPNA